MDVNQILEALDTLPFWALKRIQQRLDEVIARHEAWRDPEFAALDEREAKTYRQELVKCGKARCQQCRDGGGHGPYWYAYWTEGSRTRKQYIGKRKPPGV